MIKDTAAMHSLIDFASWLSAIELHRDQILTTAGLDYTSVCETNITASLSLILV